MLKSKPIIAFAATTDPVRAKKFFAGTLGLKLESEDPFALQFNAGGTMLRVATVPKLNPAGYTILGWSVPDIHEAIRKLKRRGIAFKRFEGMTQDDDGVWTAPGGAQIAWFSDPDGNTLSLTEFEKGTVPAKRARARTSRSPGKN